MFASRLETETKNGASVGHCIGCSSVGTEGKVMQHLHVTRWEAQSVAGLLFCLINRDENIMSLHSSSIAHTTSEEPCYGPNKIDTTVNNIFLIV